MRRWLTNYPNTLQHKTHTLRVCILSSKKNKEEEKDFAGAAGGTQNLIHLSPPDSTQESDTNLNNQKQ